MRALDTNLLVRYCTADDARQAESVERFLRRCSEEQENVFVSIPVVCELVWVLTGRFAKADVSEAILRILDEPLFRVEQAALVRRALHLYRAGKPGLTDYLIGEIAAASGCRDTVTFDKTLRGAAGFTVL